MEVADLVESNRQYQLKLALLENGTHKFGAGNRAYIVGYFLSLQDKMEKLMKYLIEKEFISNSQQYAKFTATANKSLMEMNDEEYMKQWLEFMKSIFMEANEKQKRILNFRTSELKELKERIKEIVTNRS